MRSPDLSLRRLLKRTRITKLSYPFRVKFAFVYRRTALRKVTFIGVTGSCGKTTTKELTYAALSSRLKGRRSPENLNIAVHTTIVRSKPWHDFFVQEMAAANVGLRVPLEPRLHIVQPSIGIVTNIGLDHLSAFQCLEDTAMEKGKLVESLPENGTAILNADDPNVLAMRSRCRCRVITYGIVSTEATIIATDIRCSWPDRLSLTVLYDGQRHVVRTQLCGAHWAGAVLAAIGAAVAMQVPVADAVRGIEAASPVEGRMQPMLRDNGVTFIRDDYKAPLWSIAPALQFLEDAAAARKLLVIGTISDYRGNSDRTYVKVAKQALGVADTVLFVGPKAHKCLKAKRQHPRGDMLHTFYSVEQASEYLRGVQRPGDLIMLKSSAEADRLADLCS